MDEETMANREQRLNKVENIDQLREQVAELKQLNMQMKTSLELKKFIESKLSIRTVETLKKSSYQSIDLQREYCYELFQISGFYCSKFSDDRMVFSFREDHSNAEEYALEILNGEQFELGRSSLPFSIDLKYILRETPLGDSRTLKPLIKNVRHHINCYSIRREQYDELKDVTNDISNFSLTTNIGYTSIMLSFFNIQDKIMECNQNITLYLLYKSSEVRPYKMKLDTVQFTSLSPDVDKRFQTFFKDFMFHDLQTAFERIQKDVDEEISWIKVDSDPMGIVGTGDSGSEASIIAERRQKRRKRSGRKPSQVRKTAVNQTHTEKLSLELDAEAAESSDDGATNTREDLSTKDTVNTVKKKQVKKATVEPVATRSTKKIKTIPDRPATKPQTSKTNMPKKSQSRKLNETRTSNIAIKNIHRRSLRQSMLSFKRPNPTNPEESTVSNQNLIASTPLNQAHAGQSKFISDIASMSPIEQMPVENAKGKSGK